MIENNAPFLTDVKTLRERAQQHLERGAVTDTYKGDVAEELKDSGITVNAVLPSTIDTPQNRADMPKADFSRGEQLR